MEVGQRIYQIGGTRFLVYDGDQDGIPYGHVEDEVTGLVTDSQPAEQFLKHGYWEPVGFGGQGGS